MKNIKQIDKTGFLKRTLIFMILTLFCSSISFAQKSVSGKTSHTSQKITGNYIAMDMITTTGVNNLVTKSQVENQTITFHDIVKNEDQHIKLQSKISTMEGVQEFNFDKKNKIWTLVTNNMITTQTMKKLFSVLNSKESISDH